MADHGLVPLPTTTRTLDSLTLLLHEAADRLQRQGLGPYQRIRTLRGLYYGTAHSLDFERRGSRLRNWGFNLYLQAAPPADPTSVLGPALARALKDSAVVWHRDRWVDVGHILVGLEARTRLTVSRLPLWGQGGTGLELGTWLGDLGGAAGLLVLRRLEDPAARAVPLLFSEQTYDLRPNLEGDVAGYLVARNPAAGDRLSRVQAPSFVSVARALEDYAREPDWADRWARFARLLGAPPGLRAGSLLRRQELLARVRRQTLRFAACYLLYRLRHLGRLSRATLFEASRHVEGAATELAELFLAVLEQGLGQGPEQNLVPAAARDLPDLPASPPRPPGGLLALGTLGSRVWG
ncbi:hypothetical protein [Geothrix campi]|uniref:hypothetical protein n=1 Tax=Geothrix campi TaxID=2966450 RepID=UPI002148145D|nr:hypothetical protein [Geothrix sp. SG10]